jgi:hypothetical protein
MYFMGSAFESERLAAVAAGAAVDSAAAEAEFRGWAGPSFAVAIRTAKTSVRKNATHSVARGQQDLGAICIRNDGRPIIDWKMRQTRCLFRGVARKGNGLLFTPRQSASSMQENPYHTLRRAMQLARRLSMRDAAL